MSTHVFPKEIREKITNYFKNGYSSLEVFDSILEKAAPYVKSQSQLSRCIASLKGKATKGTKPIEAKKIPAIKPPKPKTFDSGKYNEIINSLREDTPGYEFERACIPIVLDILQNKENFTNIEDANEAKDFHNPPFDFFGVKNNEPYIIEFKGSLNNFNSPGERQKQRMQKLLGKVNELNIALLQVKLRNSQYRILYNEQMDLLFDGRESPIEPIVKWINEKIKENIL
jgi:hypothetical protein